MFNGHKGHGWPLVLYQIYGAAAVTGGIKGLAPCS